MITTGDNKGAIKIVTRNGPGVYDETFRVTETGDVKAPVGNFVLGTAGKGIDFSANSHAAGMTSELLNYYEEGTWTPSYTNFTSSGSPTTLEAKYTRIGRMVTIELRFQYSASVTCTAGSSQISGLPYVQGSAGTAGFVNEVTGASIGVGLLYTANSHIYPPGFTASGSQQITMTASYFV